MQNRTLTLGHSPDPDDAFMFYALAKEPHRHNADNAWLAVLMPAR